MEPTGNLEQLAVTLTDLHATLQSMLRSTGAARSQVDRILHQQPDAKGLHELHTTVSRLREDAAGLLEAAAEGEKISATLVDAAKT